MGSQSKTVLRWDANSKEVSTNCSSDCLFIGYDIITLLGAHAFTSRSLRGCALGIRPGQSVVTETQTPKAISKNLWEKVADPDFWGMLSSSLDLDPALEICLVFLECCKILCGPSECFKWPQMYMDTADEWGAWSWEVSMGLCIQRCVTSISHYLSSLFCKDLKPHNYTASDEHPMGNGWIFLKQIHLTSIHPAPENRYQALFLTGKQSFPGCLAEITLDPFRDPLISLRSGKMRYLGLICHSLPWGLRHKDE